MNGQNLATTAAFIAEKFKDDPAGYCKGVLGFQPYAWQTKVLASVNKERRTAVRSGHGVGKTRLAAAVIHWFIATRAFPQIVCTSNTQAQLSTKLWRELAKIHDQAKNKDLYQWTATRYFLKAKPETWFASALPWTEHNSTAFAGTHEEDVLMLFDEASEIPSIIWDVTSGAMSTRGAKWLTLGNPTLNTGSFHACFGKNAWKEHDGADEGRWHGFTINAEEVENADSGYISEQLREVEGDRDHDFYRVRVLGLPPKMAAEQFISNELFEEAIEREVGDNKMAPRIMGVDVARHGDDRTALVSRWGFKLNVVRVRRGQDTMATAGDVMAERQRALDKQEKAYDYICVDDIGVGGGVTDRLKELGVKVIPVNVGQKALDPIHHQRLRDEVWAKYKKWLETGRVDKQLQEDSCSITCSYNSSGQLVMEKKDEMKRRDLASPDLADAACLTFHSPTVIPNTSNNRPKPTPPRYMSGLR